MNGFDFKLFVLHEYEAIHTASSIQCPSNPHSSRTGLVEPSRMHILFDYRSPTPFLSLPVYLFICLLIQIYSGHIWNASLISKLRTLPRGLSEGLHFGHSYSHLSLFFSSSHPSLPLLLSLSLPNVKHIPCARPLVVCLLLPPK